MSSPVENDLLEQLKAKAASNDLSERQKELDARLQSFQQKQAQRLAAMISHNNTSPVTISQVQVIDAPHTRDGFLKRICTPLLTSSHGSPYTLLEARRAIDQVANKLSKLGIYRSPISVYIDKPDATDPSTTPTDLHVYYKVVERDWKTITTGMEAGSQEGSVYGSAQIRNLFGGAESLNLYASRGSRTRSIYSAWFDTPVLSNPDLHVELGGNSSATLKPWASHEEVVKAGTARLKYLTPGGHRHELAYAGTWRQITGLTSTASPSIRLEAGDSFKSALSHTYTLDRLDNTLLPSSGYFFKSTNELAGVKPLGGDIAHLKSEVESLLALPIPLPSLTPSSSSTAAFTTSHGLSLTASLRAGLLYPLPTSSGAIQPSRISDRFQLGGPQDVRGYRQSGLGPHDGADALGGDVYAAGGLSLMTPLPRTGPDTPLRFQVFVNAGRLVALKGLGGNRPGSKSDASSTETGLSSQQVKEAVRKSVEDVKNGLPSATAGVGLVYAHPLARFELNFSVPVVMRRDELARKGVQFGVGVTFL